MSAAAATTAQARRSSRRPSIPYPELPDYQLVPGAIFWRTAWLRDLAECEALRAFWQKARRPTMPEPLLHAMAGAEINAEKEAKKSFDTLVRQGGLLYAWVPDGSVA